MLRALKPPGRIRRKVTRLRIQTFLKEEDSMKKFLVEDVKVGVAGKGFACGPVPGYVIAELCLRNTVNNEVEYHSLSEIEGMPTFNQMKKSTYDAYMAENIDPVLLEEIQAGEVKSYDNYYDFYSDLEEHKINEEIAPVWKLLAYLVRADWDEVDQMKKKCLGRCIGDFDIPVCDEEEDFMEERAEEDDSDDYEDEEDFENDAAGESSEGRDELLDKLEAAFVGQKIDVNAFVDRKENESPEGDYSAEVMFSEGDKDFRLTYSLTVNADAEIRSISWPISEKLADGEYRPCLDTEIGVKRIYDIMFAELEGWL